MSLRRSDAYLSFRSSVASKRLVVGVEEKEWQYYTTGPQDEPDAVVFLHGTSGTADSFFLQLLHLGSRGYRVLAVRYPPYWTPQEFARGLHQFVCAVGVRKVHLVGTSLGGFLALHYTALHPTRVRSLALINAFCDTSLFAESAPCLSMFAYAPEFYLKKFILDSFPQEALPPEQASAVDFAVWQLESLTREDIGARLTLNCLQSKVTSLPNFDQEAMTLIDTVDKVVLPGPLRDQLYETFPDCKQSFMKEGGDFPFMSTPDEFNVHLQVHLRRNGLFPDKNSPASAAASAAPAASDASPGRFLPKSRPSYNYEPVPGDQVDEEDTQEEVDAEIERLAVEHEFRVAEQARQVAAQQAAAEQEVSAEEQALRAERQQKQADIVSSLTDSSDPRADPFGRDENDEDLDVDELFALGDHESTAQEQTQTE